MARFGVDVDDSPLSRFDRRVESGKLRLAAFAGYAATAFSTAVYGAYRMVDAASDADESLNVLSRTFGAQTDEVLAWSKVMGETMGRSMYDLQASAGEFGSFLEPQFKGRTEEIVTMSQKLAELSVDLASFYNKSDQEMSMRLFSGLSGETEAVRRLGVDISDTSLDAFNKKTGDDKTKNKRMAALSLQEKTLLRYRKILADTAGKQNDAALTANSWANQVKKLQADMKDLAVTLGRALIPYAKQLLKVGLFLVDTFKALTVKTDALRDAFIALALIGAAAVFWNIGAAIVGADVIGLVFGLVAGVEALTVAFGVLAAAGTLAVIEDLASFFQGKETITGDLLKEVYGIQHPLLMITDLAEDVEMHFSNTLAHIKAIGETLFNMIPLVAAFNAGKSLITGKSDKDEDLFDRYQKHGGIDSDKFKQKRLQDRQRDFDASVASGIFDPAGNKGQFTSATAYQIAWNRARKQFVGWKPNMANQQDVDEHMAETAYSPPKVNAPVAPQAPTAWRGRMDAPPSQGVNSNVVINVSGVTDPIIAGTTAYKLAKKHQLDAAFEADQQRLQAASHVLGGSGTRLPAGQ